MKRKTLFADCVCGRNQDGVFLVVLKLNPPSVSESGLLVRWVRPLCYTMYVANEVNGGEYDVTRRDETRYEK